MKKRNNIICYCGSCRQDTTHEILFMETRSSDDDFWWRDDYYVAKCCGCDELTFLLESSSEDNIDYDEDGNEVIMPVYRTFPEKRTLAQGLTNMWNVPHPISRVYKETISALNDGCFMLAAAGFRMIIEATCIENGIKGSNLEIKINNLCKANIITRRDRDRLHSIRFMGNDSVHAMKMPEKAALLLVLEIVDIMIKNLYLLEVECKRILEGPITSFEEFVELLNKGLANYHVGNVVVLMNLLPCDRRLIKEDIHNFETMLISKINKGSYSYLALCPPPTQGRKQQYKIVSLP